MGKAKKKVYGDVELREAQEKLDNLKAEERTQRKLNDTLNADNRKLKKENKDLQGDNETLAIRTAKQKTMLRGLDAKVSKENNRILAEDARFAKANRDLDARQKDAYERTDQAEEAESKANKAKEATENIRILLKKERADFDKERGEINQLKKDYEKLLNDAAVEKDKASKLVAEKTDALAEVGKKKDDLEADIIEAGKIKEQHRAKKQEYVNAERETLALNANLQEAQKHLDEMKKDADELKKSLAGQIEKSKQAEKSYNKLKQALSIQKEELDLETLRVQKLVREKGIAKELEELRKEK